ncbi:hypothetical protein AYO40_06215, partial [Planctomycetaceae bacterium SCGC AG-212-D15]
MVRTLAGVLGLALLCLAGAFGDDKPAPQAAKEALKPFNTLIGSWKATGTKTRTDFWQEKVAWGWQFKGDDAWITLTFTDGKYFTSGTLRYLPDKELYRLSLTTKEKQTLDFDGKLQKEVLTVDHTDAKTKETQRLVVTMLHETRFLYRYEVRPEGKTGFARQYQVGATREGVAFASGDSRPECIVSGGLGTMKISYKGKDYYVCCSGCRDAFKDDPEKYIKEYEAK